MRKFLVALLAAFVLALPVLAQQENITVKKFAVALQDINLMSMPTAQSEVLLTVKAGEKMEVLRDLGLWLKVKASNGTVGYVRKEKIKFEEEKIISAPQPKPIPSSLSSSTQPRPSLKKFEFSANFSLSKVNPSDFNADSDSLNKVFKGLLNLPSVEGQVDHYLELLDKLTGGEAEFVFYPTEKLGLGLGFLIKSGGTDTSSTLTETSPDYLSMTYKANTKANIYAPFLSLHLRYPVSMLTLNAFAGLGYYMGNFSLKYDYSYSDEPIPCFDYLENLKKSTLGFFGGVKFQFNLTENFNLYLQGKYTAVKFKNIEGDYRSCDGTSYHGTLYNYNVEMEEGLGTGNFAWIFPSEPSEPDMRNVRPAEFDFSGLSFGAGLSIRF